MLGRRKFLGTLTAGMAATMVPAGVVNAAGLCKLREQFATLVDQDFQLKNSAGQHFKARLVALDIVDVDPDLEQFCVVFEGDDLVEGMYRIHHPAMGWLRVGLLQSGDRESGVARQRAYFSSFA